MSSDESDKFSVLRELDVPYELLDVEDSKFYRGKFVSHFRIAWFLVKKYKKTL